MSGRPKSAINYPQDWRTVDEESPVPLHAQVRARIQAAIDDGRLKPNQRLPTEADMARIFGVSIPVVRQALSALVTAGLLRKRQGQGTFVSRPRTADATAQEFAGFESAAAGQAREMVTRVVQQSLQMAPQRVADAFRIGEPAILVELERVRWVKNERRVLVTSWLPIRLGDFLITEDLTRAPLGAILKERGYVLGRGRRTVEAVAASAQQARALKIAPGASLIQVATLTFLEDGEPLEYCEAVYRADRTRLDVELVRLRPLSPGDRRPIYINAVVSPMDE